MIQAEFQSAADVIEKFKKEIVPPAEISPCDTFFYGVAESVMVFADEIRKQGLAITKVEFKEPGKTHPLDDEQCITADAVVQYTDRGSEKFMLCVFKYDEAKHGGYAILSFSDGIAYAREFYIDNPKDPTTWGFLHKRKKEKPYNALEFVQLHMPDAVDSRKVTSFQGFTFTKPERPKEPPSLLKLPHVGR